jgi:hypothetical protein
MTKSPLEKLINSICLGGVIAYTVISLPPTAAFHEILMGTSVYLLFYFVNKER